MGIHQSELFDSSPIPKRNEARKPIVMRQIHLQSLTGLVHIQEAMDIADTDTGATLWDCAYVMSHWMELNADQLALRDSIVIELGAGTGGCGIAAAALGAEHVVITDLPHLISLIEGNIKINAKIFGNATPSAKTLVWGNLEQAQAVLESVRLTNRQPTRLYVLACDIVYLSNTFEDLILTFSHLMDLSGKYFPSIETKQVILGAELRVNLPKFFELLRMGQWKYQAVDSSSMHSKYQSDDIRIFKLWRGNHKAR